MSLLPSLPFDKLREREGQRSHELHNRWLSLVKQPLAELVEAPTAWGLTKVAGPSTSSGNGLLGERGIRAHSRWLSLSKPRLSGSECRCDRTNCLVHRQHRA